MGAMKRIEAFNLVWDFTFQSSVDEVLEVKYMLE